ncbi:MAG: bifunctional glutamate N-acetyltransferase/amino-acid acetyltransferase ArgJ [Clostridiales bacterium]|nr:bifunctional glutamate N-acetyltransferase/amino-acid acetyltransferase ArgJ [Clostridiales bacterium]
MKMEYITGGVCAAQGFQASGVHCGIRRNKSKKDLALIVSETRASAACVYTQNLVKGAPLLVTRAHVADGYARAVVCNSGNANTCNANGEEIAREMCRLVSESAGIPQQDVIVASTGVIGQPLPIAPIRDAIPDLVRELRPGGGNDAAKAIMTTDTTEKEVAVRFELGGKACTIGGIAKGSGMIHPNMATMLVFLTSDVAISPALLQQALSEDADEGFNMISVDGDTSTNDMVSILCNGRAGNPEIQPDSAEYGRFKEALAAVTRRLCGMIAGDGEGATKLLLCHVTGARDKESARKAAKSVICSSLLKAAMFGADANWGRVLCALGYSGAELDVNQIDVAFSSQKGRIAVCKDGAGLDFSEEQAKEILLEDTVTIHVDLHSGAQEATAYGCDLTYDYVKINGDYRT